MWKKKLSVPKPPNRDTGAVDSLRPQETEADNSEPAETIDQKGDLVQHVL
jgi:hypothetical protein